MLSLIEINFESIINLNLKLKLGHFTRVIDFLLECSLSTHFYMKILKCKLYRIVDYAHTFY